MLGDAVALSDMFSECERAVQWAACVWCMRSVFAASSESEPGHRWNEGYVQIFDRVEHRTQFYIKKRKNSKTHKNVKPVDHGLG